MAANAPTAIVVLFKVGSRGRLESLAVLRRAHLTHGATRSVAGDHAQCQHGARSGPDNPESDTNPTGFRSVRVAPLAARGLKG